LVKVNKEKRKKEKEMNEKMQKCNTEENGKPLL
jgi:hypothetical protein